MIDPNNITTVRVDQLANGTIDLTKLIPFAETNGELKQTTVQAFADLVATIVGASDGVGFLAYSFTNGQQLPDVPLTPGFFLCGAGTYLNINGYPDVICTGQLNAVVSLSDHWAVGVEIPIVAELGIQAIESGTNITITGTGTLIDPYVINATGGGGSQDLEETLLLGGRGIDYLLEGIDFIDSDKGMVYFLDETYGASVDITATIDADIFTTLGTELILANISDSYTITIVAGSGVTLRGDNLVIGKNQIARIRHLKTQADNYWDNTWIVEIGNVPQSSILTTTITDGDTTHAPDGNAVFDALALKRNLPIAEGLSTTGTVNIDFSFDGFDKITQTGAINFSSSNTSGTKQIEKVFLLQGSTNAAHGITFPSTWKNLSGVSADPTKMNYIKLVLINGNINYYINKYDIPDSVAPTLLRKSILLEALNTIELTYDEALNSAITMQTSWFTVTGKTVTAVTIIGNRVRITVSVAFAETDTPTVTFTNQVSGDGIQDASGNKAPDFSQTIGLTVYRFDNFNRTNSTTTTDSPSDSGSNWVVALGALWGISSNKTYCAGADTVTALSNLIYLESNQTNVTVREKITFGTAAVTANTAIIMRYVDSSNYYICQIGKLSTGQLFYSVARILAGVATTLVSNTNFGTWVSGTEYTFMVKVKDSTFTLYNGTTSLVQFVDSNINGTKHGLRVFSGAGTTGNNDRWDDFGIYYGG
jgi:hypothetical protein